MAPRVLAHPADVLAHAGRGAWRFDFFRPIFRCASTRGREIPIHSRLARAADVLAHAATQFFLIKTKFRVVMAMCASTSPMAMC